MHPTKKETLTSIYPYIVIHFCLSLHHKGMGGTIRYSGIIIRQEYLQLQLHILFIQSDPQSKPASSQMVFSKMVILKFGQLIVFAFAR